MTQLLSHPELTHKVTQGWVNWVHWLIGSFSQSAMNSLHQSHTPMITIILAIRTCKVFLYLQEVNILKNFVWCKYLGVL